MSQIRDQVLGDRQTFRVADVQRDAALAGVLVVELAAHVGVLHARQRAGGGVAGGASADWAPWRRGGCRGCPSTPLCRIRRPCAARKRVPPAEARNQAKSRIRMPCSGNGLSCRAELAGLRRVLPGPERSGFRQDGSGVLTEQGGAAADLPAGPVAEPFAGGIAERTVVFGW